MASASELATLTLVRDHLTGGPTASRLRCRAGCHFLPQPTVISVWFGKKKGQDVKVVIPSPAFGAQTMLLSDALEGLGIPSRAVATTDELRFELVRKNVYILTTNIAGLVVGGTVAELWRDHETLARTVARDVIDIQEQLTGKHFDSAALITGMLEAFDGDPQHTCMGRSAPARLRRALEEADLAELAVPKLREIAAAHLPNH